MADERQSDKFSITSSLEKGMWTDNADSFLPEGTYTNAINATTVLPDGSRGGLSTECANRLSLQKAPLVLIGREYMEQRKHVTFWTDNTISEVGIYDEGTDSYTVLINDAATIAGGHPGMNFNTANLITVRVRRNYDCGFNIYWSDGGRNIDRVLDTQFLQPNPWFQTPVVVSPGCVNYVNTNMVDVRQLSLNPIYNIPCLTLAKGASGGLLRSGNYQVAIAYTINGYKVTDYCAVSNNQQIWNHTGTAGGLRLKMSNLETFTFREMEVVVISTINSNVQAKRLGLYSTTIDTLYIDDIQESLPTIPLENIPISTPAIPSSDSMWNLGDYLVRTGVRERPDFNYQPLANQIEARWIITEYPERYYHDGGYNEFPMNVGNMGGEVYAVFIRWRYTTGEVSASYPLIGPATPFTFFAIGSPVGVPAVQPDGGLIIANGTFDTYFSTEVYPNDKSSVWNSNIPGHPEWNVCGQPIRWFRFPDQTSLGGNSVFSHYWNYGTSLSPDCRIRIKGWYFTNIQPPVDLQGNLIPDIQGYEILRATRDGGNMSVLACGMVNNMRTYQDNTGSSGVFSNYPYNDISPDDYLTSNVANFNTGTAGNGSANKLTGYRRDLLSFHSPETVFGTPALGPGNLKVLMAMGGVSQGHFVEPWKHPMFKVLTNFDSWLANILASIEFAIGIFNIIATGAAGAAGAPPPDLSLAPTNDIPMHFPLLATPVPIDNVIGTTSTDPVMYGLNVAIGIANATMLTLILPFQVLAFRDQLLNVIKGLIPARQYALQYNSSGFYSIPEPAKGQSGNIVPVTDYSYILGNMQSFNSVTVNNLYRNKYVILQLSGAVSPLTGDNSRFSLGTSIQAPGDFRTRGIESYYTSYRVTQLSQYGQIDSSKQVPISCMYPVTPAVGARYSTGVIYGGDTYVVRYTEQNPFLFFNDWLVDAPQDIKYDYRNYLNVPWPMFWINNDWETYSLLGLASSNRRLDGPVNTFLGVIPGSSAAFYVNYGYFYISCNGIRDFFVETTLNMGYRDYGDEVTQQFYNPYGYQEIDQLFRTDYVKTPIFYKYDNSLSVKNSFNQWISWGVCLRRDYDPTLAFTCFNYYPRRTVYSLQASEEQKVDLWRMFLPNNYINTNSIVRAIDSISKTGGVFLFDDAPPGKLMGIESIPSSSGTDFAVGTGSLFAQGLQTLSNADGSLQYGSCQGKYCSINTPYGLFWVSQRSGKIFHGNVDGSDFEDITKYGQKYRLAQELPSKLAALFPTFPLIDNPVDGVGVQLLYDNTNEILYITKRDFVPKVDVTYSNGQWYVGCPPGEGPAGYDPLTGHLLCVICMDSCPGTPITLGDSRYFDNAGWTLSYSPAEKKFISWHRWTPTLSLSGVKHVITSFRTSLWKHNEVTNSWCNYYGTQYEFVVEAPINAGQQVVTVENIEYILDSFRYRPNEIDKFNQYADTFNVAQVYNEEQSTLPLFLNQTLWNNPYDRFNYPNIIGSGMNIQYTKVENKFRFPSGNSSLRDFTNDRGQFTLTNVQMKVTSPNGYSWTPQNLYFDALKNPFEQKKLRHRSNRVMLMKTDLTVNSVSLYAIKTNVVISPR